MGRHVVIALAAVVSLSIGAFAQTPAGLVPAVRAAMAGNDMAQAERLVREFRAKNGPTPEALAALSWLGRGALAAKDLDAADRHARETHALALTALKTTPLNTNAELQTALGAAIETEALVLVARGARSEAVAALRKEVALYRGSAIEKRLAKNLNALSLEGQPALPLERAEHLERDVPAFSALKGKTVLLFFWAHWCPDCKAQGPVLARLLTKYRDRGLTLVAPTQRFGYTPSNEAASPAEELRHIVSIRDSYYPFLRDYPVPLAEANHRAYGVSSTPTLALLDKDGLVRMYHPGQMTEAELEATILKWLPASAQGH